MSQRLRPRDVAFLTAESSSTPMHNATVEIFEPGESGFDYDRLVELIEDRLSFVPRYRQRVRFVPGHLANPEWVEDPDFDLSYHVRRSALPRPGTRDQLLELAARIVSRPLDRHRPLWEVYVIEGLEDGHVALLSKTHLAVVDGVDSVDLGQVLLDLKPEQETIGGDQWRPRRLPTPLGLIASAVSDTARDPQVLGETIRSNAAGAVRRTREAATQVGRVAGALTNQRPVPESPLLGQLSQQRRVLGLATDLSSYRKVRDAHGGSVNDVILATIAGGLRGWLMTRAESLAGVRQVRTVVPVSVIDESAEATTLGQIKAHWVDLPIGEASPVVRLHQVSYSFQAHKETGRGVAANRLAGIAGFAPVTFHAIGARVAAAELRRGFALNITNVPGPQSPLHAAGAQMIETYPVPPLLPGHALAIGATSYRGQVFYGITVDRDLIPDADVLGACLLESLDELVDTAGTSRTKAPRGRKKR